MGKIKLKFGKKKMKLGEREILVRVPLSKVSNEEFMKEVERILRKSLERAQQV